MELIEQIKLVAKERQEKSELEQIKRQKYEQWEVENQDLLERLKVKSETLIDYENTLRELTIKAFEETGNKKPAEGVGIRETKVYKYDSQEALKWAKEHQLALSLDKKAFEDIAKSTELDFVDMGIEIKATIATDLTNMRR